VVKTNPQTRPDYNFHISKYAARQDWWIIYGFISGFLQVFEEGLHVPNNIFNLQQFGLSLSIGSLSLQEQQEVHQKLMWDGYD